MIRTGEASAILSGGVEQMSQVPYVIPSARFGTRMGNVEVEDSITAALFDKFAKVPMAITAENLAAEYDITRQQADEHSIRSQTRYRLAADNNYFNLEITPVTIETRKGNIIFGKDEHPKKDATLDKVSQMKALFKENGVVTAATASGIVDGAGANLLMSEGEAKRRKLRPLAKILSWAAVGCDPKMMGIGPVVAIQSALNSAHLTIDQIDLFEVNEAFSAQYLAVEKVLGLDPEITNVNGGAIAVGHPLGATGSRIMNHLMYELMRRKGRYGVGSACIGGGQGVAIVIERI